MKAIWKKLRELGAGAWALLAGLVFLVLALLGHRSAQEKLRERRRAQDARVLEELERETAAAKEREARRARLLELERAAAVAAKGREALEVETRRLEAEIRHLSDEELEARWRALVAGKGEA